MRVSGKDKVLVRDGLLLTGGGNKLVSVPTEKEPVQIVGKFSLVCRERGKIVQGSRREGENIWTLTGREYSARVMSYSAYSTDVPARNDRIRYIGFGTGTTPEVSTVSQLVTPIAYEAGIFLAELAIPSYPFQSGINSFGTAVRYTREFTELELSTEGTVDLSEAGLFTDGSPASNFTPGTRDRTLANAAAQAPMAYKSFEPVRKTQSFVLQVAWEIRF